MIAFFCETPYQFVCGMNLVYSVFKEETTVFLTRDMFKSEVKFDIDGSQYGYITKIFYVERYLERKNIFKLIYGKIKQFFIGRYEYYMRLFVPDITKEYLERDYEKIIGIKYSSAATCLYHCLKNKPAVYQIEEGIGEYLIFDMESNNEFDITKYVQIKYLSEPKLYPFQDSRIRKMPKLCEDRLFRDTLEHVFHFRKELGIYKRFIYFDQPIGGDYEIEDFELAEKKCLSVFEKILEDEDFVIKRHPRNQKGIATRFSAFHTIAPWECCLSELDNLDESVLISISSTALLTPKLLGGKEPYLIILTRLFTESMKSRGNMEEAVIDKIAVLFEKTRQLYNNPNKIFMPESLDELEEILLMLKKGKSKDEQG